MARSQIDDPISQRLEKIYSSKSNQEISELLSSWGSLSPLERRFLLAETRGRLNGEKRKDLLRRCAALIETHEQKIIKALNHDFQNRSI